MLYHVTGAWLNGHWSIITLKQYVCYSGFLRRPSLSPACSQSHWPVGFSIMTSETGHSVLLTQPGHFGMSVLGDHSFNSNDCRCGSQCRLMTSSMGSGKCLPRCLWSSLRLSVSTTQRAQSFLNVFIHSSIHEDLQTRTAPIPDLMVTQAYNPFSNLTYFGLKHVLWTHNSPGDRWTEDRGEFISLCSHTICN